MNARLSARSLFLGVLLLLSACSAVAPPGGDQDGIGGTGIIARQDGDGIGGTGVIGPGDADNDGIGGTGTWPTSGDVALFGVVTNLDPLVINGHGMVLNESTQVYSNGRTVGREIIKSGSVAWVKAGIRNGVIAAVELSVQTALRGPIENYSEQQGMLSVLGRTVIVTDYTTVGAGQLSAGQWVEVAGISDPEGNIKATLIETESVERIAFTQSPAKNLPFLGEVGSYSIQSFAVMTDSQLSLKDIAGSALPLNIRPADRGRVADVEVDRTLIVEFKPVAGGGFELTRVRSAPPRYPDQSVIPQYRPPTPIGVLVPGQLMNRAQDSAGDPGQKIDLNVGNRASTPSQPSAGRQINVKPTQIKPRVIDRVPAPISPRPPPAAPNPVDALPSAGGTR